MATISNEMKFRFEKLIEPLVKSKSLENGQRNVEIEKLHINS